MMSPVVLCLSALALLSLLPETQSNINVNVQTLVNELWKRVADGRIVVTSPNLDTFLSRYDPASKASLNLLECNFKTGVRSWVQDFGSMGITTEFAAAYFKALDVHGRSLYSHLTIEDVDELVEICEKHASRCYSRCRGILSEADFKKGFESVIFRYLPFTLLFVRYTRHDFDPSFSCYDDASLTYKVSSPNTQKEVRQKPEGVIQMGQNTAADDVFNKPFQYEQMTHRDWTLMFIKMDKSRNRIIELKEVQDFWSDGLYGSRQEGTQFFKVVADGREKISETDWEALFYELDCRNSNRELDIMEFLQLDLLFHGRKKRSDGRCVLERE